MQGKTSRFLQGPLTSPKTVLDLNNKIESGLPMKTKVINYRHSGIPFENDLTVLPIYSWSDPFSPPTYDSSALAASIESSNAASDEFPLQDRSPSHFIARLAVTPDQPDLPHLTAAELSTRDAYLNSFSTNTKTDSTSTDSITTGEGVRVNRVEGDGGEVVPVTKEEYYELISAKS